MDVDEDQFLKAILDGLDGPALRIKFGLKRNGLHLLVLSLIDKLPSIAQKSKIHLYYGKGSCSEHGQTVHYRTKSTKYWKCKQCEKEVDSKRNKTERRKGSVNGNRVKRTRKRKKDMIQARGGKCSKCEYATAAAALHFHHIDPFQKITGVGKLLDNAQAANDEADKCIILCANCHMEHELEAARNKPKNLRGTNGLTLDCDKHGKGVAAVRNHDRPSLACAHCNNEKYRLIRRKKKKDCVNLLGSECSLCAYKNFECLQFHHLVPNEKTATISKLVSLGKRKSIIFEEAKKCILLCPNCHVEVEEGMHDKWLQPILVKYKKTKDTSKIVF